MTTDTQTAREKIKSVVTPYAFGVADELLGKPLGKPLPRLFAILVDFLVVLLLATFDWVFLALVMLCVAPTAIFRWRKRTDRRGASIFLGVVTLLSALILLGNMYSGNADDDESSVFQLGGVSVDMQGLGDNDDERDPLLYELKSVSPPFSSKLSELEDKDGDRLCSEDIKCNNQFFDALLDELIDTPYDHDEAITVMNGVADYLNQKDLLDPKVRSVSFSERLYLLRFLDTGEADNKHTVNIVEWVTDALNDLGLSLGWAAVYFSILTAWWNGQTVGKKLFGLRVVGIDGKNLDLWASFERYGGYGAGLATGLLGFAQVYWDDNRQAIHDKISETVVLRTRVK